MKYWLPIWLATILFGIFGVGTPDPSATSESSSLTVATQNSGAKLIGGLTPGGEGPTPPEDDTP